MTQVLTQAFALVFIVFLGYVFQRAGWARAEHFAMLTKVVLYVTLPAMLMTAFNKVDLTPKLLLIPLLSFILGLSLHIGGWLMERKSPPPEKAFGILNASSFNVGAFATPYVSLFIGSHAIVYSSLFDVGVTFATAGVAFAWAMAITSETGRASPLTLIGHMFRSPVFVTYLFLLIMRLFDLHLLPFVVNVATPIGAANPFLAMFMIGVGLEVRLRRSKYAKAAKFLAVRYSVLIAVGIAAWFLLPYDHEVRVILCVVLASPIAVMTAAFTLQTKGDVELSTFMISASVLVSIVAMPLLFLALS